MDVKYKITEEQKNKISPYLQAGTKLFINLHGNIYMSKVDVDYMRNKDGLFNLIIKQEFGIDDVDAWLNALPNFSFESIQSAAEDGFDAYRDMIAKINNAGGLTGDPSKLDTGIMIYTGYNGDVMDMIVPMTQIRNMMKDGFFEYALRSMEHYSDPRAVGITPTVKADNISIIREVAKKHGRVEDTLNYAQGSAKGTLVM